MRGGSFLFGLMLGGLASGLFLYLDWTRSSSTLALPESTIILEFKTPGGKARSIRAGEVRDDVRLKLKKVENDVLEIYRQAAKDKMFISALEAAEGKPELANLGSGPANTVSAAPPRQLSSQLPFAARSSGRRRVGVVAAKNGPVSNHK